MVATLFGIAVGPEGFGLVHPLSWENNDKLTLEFARIVIALQVFAAGVSLPKAYLVKELRSLSILLLPVMFFMWLVAAYAIQYFLSLSTVCFKCLYFKANFLNSVRVSFNFSLYNSY